MPGEVTMRGRLKEASLEVKVAVWLGWEGGEGRASGVMLASLFLVSGNVFARKMGDGLYVEPDVKMLKWEEGKSTGDEAERGEKSGKQRGE